MRFSSHRRVCARGSFRYGALGRYALLGAALSIAIFVARFNALSVLLGFSILVVGIMSEAVYSTVRSFAE
jgi:hypothetical protein